MLIVKESEDFYFKIFALLKSWENNFTLIIIAAVDYIKLLRVIVIALENYIGLSYVHSLQTTARGDSGAEGQIGINFSASAKSSAPGESRTDAGSRRGTSTHL